MFSVWTLSQSSLYSNQYPSWRSWFSKNLSILVSDRQTDSHSSGRGGWLGDGSLNIINAVKLCQWLAVVNAHALTGWQRSCSVFLRRSDPVTTQYLASSRYHARVASSFLRFLDSCCNVQLHIEFIESTVVESSTPWSRSSIFRL